jgi:hypothetical protein
MPPKTNGMVYRHERLKTLHRLERDKQLGKVEGTCGGGFEKLKVKKTVLQKER